MDDPPEGLEVLVIIRVLRAGYRVVHSGWLGGQFYSVLLFFGNCSMSNH